MNRLSIELKRIAEEVGGMEDVDLPLESKPVQTEIKVPARVRSYLDKFAKGLPGNIDDHTDIVSKAIDYMRESRGDEYYDYDALVGFFELLKNNVKNFDGLRSYGLDDVAEKLGDEIDKKVEFSDIYDDSVVDELELKLVAEFCSACQKYVKAAISTVTDMAWEGLDEALENLVDSFYVVTNLDFNTASATEIQNDFLSLYDSESNDRGSLIGFLRGTGAQNASAAKSAALKKFAESFSNYANSIRDE